MQNDETQIVDSATFRVLLGGPEQDTWDVVSKLGLVVDPFINQRNFPLTTRAQLKEVEVEIVELHKSCTDRECLNILAMKGLQPPTSEIAIRFVEQHTKVATATNKFLIFLHQPVRAMHQSRIVLALLGLEFILKYLPTDFRADCCLVGVRP